MRTLWTLSHRDINQAPREQEPNGTASLRFNPNRIKFLIWLSASSLIYRAGQRSCFVGAMGFMV